MSGEWRPATTLEQALLDAVHTNDQQRYLDLLYGTELLVPVRQDGGWAPSTVAGRTYLLAYTSASTLRRAYGRAVPTLTRSFPQFVAGWPDPEWWLVVNPATPIEVRLSPAHLARRAALTRPDPQPAPDLPATSSDTVPRRVPSAATEPSVEPPAAPETLPRSRQRTRFRPVNETEQVLLGAVDRGDADAVLKALLLTELVLPVPDDADTGLSPRSEDFRWRVYQSDGELCVPVFTSATRCAEALGSVPTVLAEGLEVVHAWPDESLTLLLNPGSPVGASLPGPQVADLAGWAADVGLVDILYAADSDPGSRPDPDPESQPDPEPDPGTDLESDVDAPAGPLVLQKLLPHRNVAYYLQHGYDLVSGLVHPAADVAGVTDLAALYAALGLDQRFGFTPGDPGVHLVRWVSPSHPDPGPQPPGQVRQFRAAGVRLPHGAELRYRDWTGAETPVAVYDADRLGWRPAEDRAGSQSAEDMTGRRPAEDLVGRRPADGTAGERP